MEEERWMLLGRDCEVMGGNMDYHLINSYNS